MVELNKKEELFRVITTNETIEGNINPSGKIVASMIAPKGAKGDPGVTPTIGENGNWYLGDTDTGKPSKGEKGDKGDKGDTGAQGPKGDTGEQGIQGPQGATGPAGQNGTNGTDGFSPIATVTQENDITTISITDKNGTTTSSVNLTNYANKEYVDNAIANAITTTLEGSY